MNKKWTSRQKDRQIDIKRNLADLKNPTLWVSQILVNAGVANAGLPDTTCLYYPHLEGVTQKGSLWPAWINQPHVRLHNLYVKTSTKDKILDRNKC